MNKKNTLKKLFAALAISTCSSFSFGQVIFSENFEGTMDGTTLIPTGWTETGAALNDGLYFVGTSADANAAGAWPVPAHTKFVMTNDDDCVHTATNNICNKAADRLILPNQDFSTVTTGLKLNFAAVLSGEYGNEKGTVEVSTDAGATWTVIYSIDTVLNTWQNISVPLNAYAGMTGVKISFKYNDGGGWMQGLAIDDVAIEVVPDYVDAKVLSSTEGQYTIVPVTQMAAVPVSVTVSNWGSTSLSAAAVTTRIYKAPNFTTPITTLNGTSGAIAEGANAAVSMGNFTPAASGDYIFEHYVTVAGDVEDNNDTLYTTLSIDANEYARDNASPARSVGIGPGATGVVGNVFDVVLNAKMDSVLFFINYATAPSPVGNVIQIKISQVTAGVPSTTYVGESAPYTITAADLGAKVLVLPVTAVGGGVLNLTPGAYFVGLSQNTSTGQNFRLQCAESKYTSGTVFGSINGGAYAPLSSLITGFNLTPIIRPYINPICTMTATASTTEAGCGLSDGTATVTPAAGTAPYTYLWNNTPAATTATATGLAQGVYEVKVTDLYGCKATVSNVTVTNPNSPMVTLNGTVTNVTCNGLSNGAATVAVTGGTTPYTYAWAGNTSTTASATGLAAGSYVVTVLDDNNCSGTLTVDITAPTALTSTSTFVAPDCNGGTDGTATVVAAGGTTPYTYAWTPNTTATTATATGLAAGTYTTTITDANGCTKTQSTVITQPTAMVLTSVITGASTATNGKVNLTVTGGTSPYTYAWNNSTTTQDLNNVAAGTYTVTVTDANGCTATHTAVVADIASIGEIEGAEILIFPNPSNGNFTVSVEGINTGKINVEVLDLAGKVIYTNSMNVSASKTIVPMNLSGVSAGTYLVKLNTEAGSAMSRIIIE